MFAKRLAKLVACFAACAALAVLQACTTTTESAATAAPSERAIAEGNAGQTIQLKVGDTLVVTLEGNISTGYSWEVATINSQALQQVGESEFKSNTDMPGSPGHQTMRFKAIAKGQGELKLVYHRPWEKDVAPIKTYSVTVEVK